MQLVKRRDMQRITLSALIALGLHALIFLAVGLFGLLHFEEGAPAYGAMYVEISAPGPEMPAAKPPVDLVRPPAKTDSPATAEKGAPAGVPSVSDPTEKPQVQPTRAEEKYIPSPVRTEPAPPTNVYSAREANGSSLGIEMGKAGDMAKPNWRTYVKLPRWVTDDPSKKLELVILFVVGKDGRLSAEPVVEKSSGHPDVDAAVIRAMTEGQGWKFSNPSQDGSSIGRLTYRINQ
jgi:outer membrane biosynthesis protein TonB